jgi:hypothetical protein
MLLVRHERVRGRDNVRFGMKLSSSVASTIPEHL